MSAAAALPVKGMPHRRTLSMACGSLILPCAVVSARMRPIHGRSPWKNACPPRGFSLAPPGGVSSPSPPARRSALVKRALEPRMATKTRRQSAAPLSLSLKTARSRSPAHTKPSQSGYIRNSPIVPPRRPVGQPFASPPGECNLWMRKIALGHACAQGQCSRLNDGTLWNHPVCRGPSEIIPPDDQMVLSSRLRGCPAPSVQNI